MKKTIDVLNLEWSSYPSRDRQMATLVCNYLRHMGYNVVEGPIFNGYHLLNKYKPRLYFNVSPLGADVNFDIMKYARSRELLGVSLIAEGNFKEGEKNVNQFLWGCNKDKILYENVHMQWSERTRKMSLQYYPELKDKIKVSGGVGFDIYKISKNQERMDFLKKYKKDIYKKVIGLGCWDFGAYYPEDERYLIKEKLHTKEEINRFRKDGKEFNKILNSVITNNQDILFILKEHPGSKLGKLSSAIEGTERFSNVLILKNEEPIIDCINVSDFWLAYDSTTSVEAWLSGKQTALLNPSAANSTRGGVFTGSPNYDSVEELQYAINKFYKDGDLPHFSELEKNRRKIIRDVLQWDDGLNHVRAGNEIIDLLEEHTKIKKENVKQVVSRYWQMTKWYLSPYLKFLPKIKNYYHTCRNRFDENELKNFQEKRMKEQITFYEKNGLKKEDLRRIRCI